MLLKNKACTTLMKYGFEITSTLESVEFYRMDLGLEEYVNPKSSTHLIQFISV